MNPNSFFTPLNNSHSALSNNERLKSLFKSELNESAKAQNQIKNLESLSVQISSDPSSGRQIFSKSIEYSLGVKFDSTYEFKIPSPKEVATTVLGFVENRINLEKASGASNERLTNLMSQARAGVEKGYAQAEKDIKDLGLMTDELKAEIAEGLGLIHKGLDGIQSKFANEADASLVESKKQSVSDVPLNPNNESKSLFDLSAESLKSKQVEAGSSLSLKQLTENNADFVLNTQEGDQVYIRMRDLQKLAYQSNSSSSSLNISQSSVFEFSVKGDLNEKELTAINDLLSQVGTISSQFFNEQFDEAFNSALNLGFDASQIASFSLELSALQRQEVKTYAYEQSPKTALDSYKRYQPLVNMAQKFESLESLLPSLDRFETINSIVEALVDKALDRYASDNTQLKASEDKNLFSDFKEFVSAILEDISSK